MAQAAAQSLAPPGVGGTRSWGVRSRTLAGSLGALLVASLMTAGAVLTGASPAAADTAPIAPVTVATVSADALPTTQINGVAYDQTIVGNTVYVTGNFTSARPAGVASGTNETARSNILAYNVTTGVLSTTWAPTLNGLGRSIKASTDGKRIFVAGSFTSVTGTTRNRVVALDATTGAVITTFNPNANARVDALAVSGNTLYLGGIFSTVGGAARANIAAVSADTGAVLPFNPNANAEVIALTAPAGSGKVVAGGRFVTIGGASVTGMAALDATSGVNLPWAISANVQDYGDNAAIYSLSSDANHVYGTGYNFGCCGNFEGTFSANISDGSEVYATGCYGDTYDAYPVGGVLYSVGHRHDCSSIGGNPEVSPRAYQHAMAQTTGQAASGLVNCDCARSTPFVGQPAPELLHWLPTLTTGTFTGQTQAAWTVEGNSNYVVLGGEFPTVNGIAQQGLVRFATEATSPVPPNKEGPQGTTQLKPTLLSPVPGKVRISWQAAWDRDNRNLTYQLLRGASLSTASVISTQTLDSAWWNRPTMNFQDTTATPGSSQTYRIRAYDAFNNTVVSSTTAVTVATSSGPYATAVLNDSPTHLWRLGESSGTAGYDYVAVDDLTVDSSATRGATGAMPNESTVKSTTFSGGANVPATTSTLVDGPQTFSEEAWFNTTSTTGGKIIGFGNSNTGDSGGYDRHVYMSNSGQIVFGVYPGGVRTITSASAYNDGQWHHVVANLGSDGMELYLDGVRVAKDTSTTSAQSFQGYWRIGGDNLNGWSGPGGLSSFKFTGSIEDVAVYAAPLTKAQIQAHYTASGRTVAAGPTRPADAYGAAVWDAAPSFYWRLDEASGAAAPIDRITNTANGAYASQVVKGEAGAPANSAGTSIRLTGDVDQAVVATDAVTNPTVYSLETWFKTSSTNGGRIIGFGDSNNPNGRSSNYDRYVYMLNDGTLRFGTWTGQTNLASSTAAYNDGKWHQVVATQDSSGMTLYVDGAVVGTNPNPSAQAYTGYWRLGTDNTWGGASSDNFAGSFDEAAVYSTSLSASTVSQHWQLGKPAGN